MANKTAHVAEVFLSVQGEGVWVGARQVFVRFAGCHLDCSFCDSAEARHFGADLVCRVHHADGGGTTVKNPINSDALTALVANVGAGSPLHSVAVTGGEPLLQHRFLGAWLPHLREAGYSVFLETSGDQAHALRSVARFVDYCAMDIKLPSSTGLRPMWQEHRAFLAACRESGIATCVKMVVSDETTMDDVVQGCHVVRETWAETPVVLQPCSPVGRLATAPSFARLLALQGAALMAATDVRIIPQTHRMLSAP